MPSERVVLNIMEIHVLERFSETGLKSGGEHAEYLAVRGSEATKNFPAHTVRNPGGGSGLTLELRSEGDHPSRNPGHVGGNHQGLYESLAAILSERFMLEANLRR